MIGTLDFWGMGPCAAVVGAVNEGIFISYLREVLLPNIEPGSVIVMDRLRVHRTEAVRDLVEDAGCRLLFLPPYSPDLNPIEEAWSKVKQHLRRAAARTVDSLFDAISKALDTVRQVDAWGWFIHSGYC